MLVSRISPAPSAATSVAHSITSMPVGVRPPWITTCHWSTAHCFASIAATTHCAPKRADASPKSSGRFTPAVLIETLSAPALSSARMSSTVLTPPPTVSGMNTWSATASIMP